MRVGSGEVLPQGRSLSGTMIFLSEFGAREIAGNSCIKSIYLVS